MLVYVENSTYLGFLIVFGSLMHKIILPITEESFFFFFKDLFLLFFNWKGGYTERRDREEDLPSDDSLPK